MTFKQTIVMAAMAAAVGMVGFAGQMKDTMVGGAAMYPNQDIVDNTVASQDHTFFLALIKVADLVKTLKGPGPYTVFAPTNEAFDKLPAGAMDKLLRPESQAELAKILTYQIVPGRITSKQLEDMIMRDGGHAELKTVEGEHLTAMMNADNLTITDQKGDVAKVIIPDVYQKNGIIDVVNTVLMPK